MKPLTFGLRSLGCDV